MDSKTLALYLGCQFIGKYKDWAHENNVMTLCWKDLEPNKFEYIKPILRPLSSMTEDEVNECRQMVSDLSGKRKWGDSGLRQIGHSKLKLSQYDSDFHITKWLLSKGFDLFGLIESGNAISSTP